MTTVREYTLDKAKACVLKDRNLNYDEPEKNFDDIARLWNVYLQGKDEIEPHDVAVMCMLIKVARIRKSPEVEDHWIDIAGYAACGAECVESGYDVPQPYFVSGGVSLPRNESEPQFMVTYEHTVWREDE